MNHLSGKSLIISGFFLVLLFGALLNIGAFHLIDKRPLGPHQWAQCDRASVAYNFYNGGMDFFHPRVHNRSNGTGITGMEFPILNYTAAIAYKIFGYHEYLYRLLVGLIVIVGFIYSYRISGMFIQNPAMQILCSLLFVFSPVLVFYTFNFVPDIASMGLGMISWYYFLLFMKTGENRQSRYFLTILLFATLIKITSLIILANWIFLWWFSKKDKLKNNLSSISFKKVTVGSVIILLPVFAWYSYASWLNTEYKSGFFLLEPKPLHSISEFFQTVRLAWKAHGYEYYPGTVYAFLSLGLAGVIINFKKINKTLFRIVVIQAMMFFLFFLVMGPQFIHHDYYIITFLPIVFFSLILIVSWMEKILPAKRAISISFIALLTLAANYSMIQSKKEVHSRYTPYSWQYGNELMDNYFHLEPVLRKAGILKDDLVMSFDEVSPNITLYLMNQPGITLVRGDSLILKRPIASKLKYAILNDTIPDHIAFLKPFIGKYLFSDNGISVYTWEKK